MIAFMLPGLHNFTKSEWLAYGVHWQDIQPIILQTMVYLVFALCSRFI